tara:strand:+ start:118 stop:951 length:834 start_codon:yes stop_codon:yes gene_type:complete
MKLDEQFDYTYLALGAGVQSSALLVLACTDDRVPKPDVAIFADTGDEPQYVYDYLKILTKYAKPYGVDVVIATGGVLSESVFKAKETGNNFLKIPVYTRTEGHGMLRRRCTADYKITPVAKKVRELLGYRPRQRIKKRVRAMLGISLDEMQRMKESWFPYIVNTFPLIDLGIRREHCLEICSDAGLPEPSKSACVYCPYHSDKHWQWMKDIFPAEFAKAVEFDRQLRNVNRQTEIGNDDLAFFVHKSCQPLDEVEFNAADKDQVDMFNNECDGMCGV